MIIVYLRGGLGNQMFQYACGKALAEYHDTDCRVDVSWFSKSNLRSYELNVFQERPLEASKKEIDSFTKLGRSRIHRLVYRGVLNYRIVRGGDFSFREIASLSTRNTYLIGYWQSEKYFTLISGIIKETFRFKDEVDIVNKQTIKEIREKNSVSIHIRRGDYISNPITNKFHGVCDMGYYRDAISLINEHVESPFFFIFSDDPAWVRQEFGYLSNKVIVTHNLLQHSFEDMRLMSMCKHNIIANSSFSWWGAWLNKNSSKIVIGPKKWFADTGIEYSDILPSSWIKL